VSSASETPADLARGVLQAEVDVAKEPGANAPGHLTIDQLPGTGETHTSLRDGLRKAGTRTFAVLLAIAAFDNLQSSGLAVLAPNIQASFHVSSSAVVFVTGVSGGFLVLGILPMGWLADRFRRAPIAGWAALFLSAMVIASGLATNLFLFFWARFFAGISQASTQTVHTSLLADSYPISMRGRIGASIGTAMGVTAAVSPLLVGAIAEAAGGISGWRWAFYVLAIPIVIAGIAAFRIYEPPRGQYEKLDVLGEVIEDVQPIPPSLEAAFQRILRVHTIKMCLVAFSAIGFGLFTGPVLGNLFLKQQYHLDTFQRGLIATIGGVGVIVVLPVVGRYYDRLYREDPSRALALVGRMVVPVALLTPIQYFMPNAVLWTIFSIPTVVLLAAAFALVSPIIQTVAPYRLRGMTGAVGAIYLFFIGATGGSLLSALIDSSFGPRVAVLVIVVPATLVGGLLIIRGSHFIKDDLSLVVAELHEEQEEHQRQLDAPETVPALQLNAVDFSYGNVQILFDLGFEVQVGEVLALLGTNGAGKSTALRVAAGLGTPEHGVVRLHGQTITYTTAEQRTHLGIHLLPGGQGVFPDMTVRENLEMGGFIYRSDRADLDRRIARVLGLFPVLTERLKERADSLSGGQQQILALALVLLHDPKVLLIDELSLGLAPIIVQGLIEVIGRLKSEGLTMVIVEQSLNVAASIADRAVFLEKGRVQFEGPIRHLMERDDLARAVFLGGNASS
jgi:ABC-type branched-subunit amino acid transport system ATPase component/predicted MFS family arabinose efflux permease